LGKTKLTETLGRVLGLDARRVQCTPDLMPPDIVGTEVLEIAESGQKGFRFIPGPVFCQVLMADEINRAAPRTQSALLQAMQELEVTVGGITRPLPRPFHVLATQNPLEQEGTYPLPEAQLDRFMMEVRMTYPQAVDERAMLIDTTGADEKPAARVLEAKEIIDYQDLVRRLPIGDAVVDGILRLVQAGRPEQSTLDKIRRDVIWGPGPRAAQALMLASRAKALLDGRFAPSLDDVADLAPAVLRHRMALSPQARAEGRRIEAYIRDMIGVLG
jgi:MoxR-like ATPase